MSFEYKGVKCDTLKELEALRAAEKPSVNKDLARGLYGVRFPEDDAYDRYRVHGHRAQCSCDECQHRVAKHLQGSFAG